jgi:DNA invertase Pin-like site-specific DNA recombinase
MVKRSPCTEPAVRATTRCAIYTRKSTEEGLDQVFNSLDAQREACAAYILSQRHEGWTLVPDYYDDGGYSGGNMERPGLRQLLADVQAGRVDVIVVYKVDRLTRALSDFAKIVEILDASGASFVSITQAFNTTTSMGRLTLNVLLSFAQFEREVISERVRDKIAASKRKGMWMGGTVPLGYDVEDRKLVVNETEAETVRHIYRRYLELGTVQRLIGALEREGIVSKRQLGSTGSRPGGRPFSRGALYHLLTNRTYRGEVVHRDQVFPGEHEAIVPLALWDEVEARLGSNGLEHRSSVNARDPSLLVGRIRDGEGRRLTPSHAAKGSVRYRYYVSVDDEGEQGSRRPRRIAAGDIEGAVLTGLRALLDDQPALIERLGTMVTDAGSASAIAVAARALQATMTGATTSALRDLVGAIDVAVIVGDDGLDATFSLRALAQRLGIAVQAPRTAYDRCTLAVGSAMNRRGHELRLIVPAPAAEPAQRDGRLIALLLKAQEARRQLLEAPDDGEGSARTFSDKHLARMARLAFLAPDMVAAILDGRQPKGLTARRLLRAAEVPLAWHEQRRMFGFA